MHTKKQRIISFLMAFLLIFTFAFINPLTMSKSYAAVPVLTVAGQRIIAAVLVSSGIVIKGVDGLSDTQKQDMMEDFTNYIWWTMSLVEKATILSLEIIDNVVNIPVSVYNMLKEKVQKMAAPNTYSATLEAQGITTKYSGIVSDSADYPNIYFPVYEGTYEDGEYEYKKYDMTEAEPFFVYEGEEGSTILDENNITKNIFNYSDSVEDIPDFTTNDAYIYCVPGDLSFYKIPCRKSNEYAKQMMMSYSEGNSSAMLRLYFISSIPTGTNLPNTFKMGSSIIFDAGSSVNSYKYSVVRNIMKIYFIKNISSENNGILYEILDFDGNVLYQKIDSERLINTVDSNKYGISTLINQNYSDVINSDMTFEIESSPAPVVTNTDATENVLTLPTDLASSVGITSTDVNVGTTTDTGSGENTGTNTETMDNINTNVGELVTGGELGEQVNTNIGTVEGLHNELTQSADFSGLMDILAEYINFMDISAISWLTTAIPLAVAPFIPFVSLGMILFFIDRVLNGGA